MVKRMDRRQYGTKPLYELLLTYWRLRKKLQWYFEENAFENVLNKIATIFSLYVEYNCVHIAVCSSEFIFMPW